MAKTTITTLLIIATLLGFVWVLNYGLNKSEIAECMKLEQQSTEYKNFYLTDIENQMCTAHGFKINAPVK